MKHASREQQPNRRTEPRSRWSFGLLATVIACAFCVFGSFASTASALTIGLSFSSNDTGEETWESIEHSGADLYRMNITWSNVSDQGNWRESPAWQQSYDPIFEQAAKHGITILADIYGRDKNEPVHQFYLPEETDKFKEFQEFAWTVVQRYGRGGTFWSSHSSLPYRPVTDWEVWNEPNLPLNNPGEKVLPQKYAEFLVSTSSTIKAAQANARKAGEPNDMKVLHGGLYQPGGTSVWTFVETAHNVSGYGSSFDGLSLHPYSFSGNEAEKLSGVEQNIGIAHAALAEFVGGKSIWVTELGWPTMGTEVPNAGSPVTEGEQANLLTKSFDWIKAHAGTYGIELATWYFYKDLDEDKSSKWDHHCGLRKADGTYRPSWWAFEEETGASKWPVESKTIPRPAAVEDDAGHTHLYYRGPNGQLQEWYQSGELWRHRDWGYANAMGGDPSAFVDAEGKRFVYFKSADGQLQDWWFKGPDYGLEKWGYANAMGGDPSAFVDAEGKRFVYFKSADGQLQDWWFKGPDYGLEKWGYANAMGGDPSAFVDAEGKRFVYFKSADGQLQDWWFKGPDYGLEKWGYANAMGGDPSAFVDAEGKRFVYFKSADGQLQDWWFKGPDYGLEKWGYANAMGGDPSAFVDAEGKRFVYFKSADGQLQDWWFKGPDYGLEKWGYANAMGGDPAGLVTEAGREVFYFDPEAWPYAWSFSESGSSSEKIISPPVNFIPKPAAAVDSEGHTHLYYRGPNGQLQEWYQSGELWRHRDWGYANAMGGDPSAFVDAEGKRFVYFKSADGQLQDWWFKGPDYGLEKWGYANAMGGDPSAFVDAEGKRFVYFKSADGQLQDWWFKGPDYGLEKWGYANAMGGDPSAFVDAEGKRFVYFKSADGQLQDWWFKGPDYGLEKWGYANAMGGDPSAFVDAEGKRFVYFKSADGQLQDWWFKGPDYGLEKWGYANAMGGDPSAFVDAEGKRFVYFKSADGQLQDWWFKGPDYGLEKWGYANAMGGDPAGLVTEAGREVFYFDPEAWPYAWSFSESGSSFLALE